MTVLRVCYKHGVRFDEAYYLSKRMPLVSKIMGPYGIKGAEILKVTTTVHGSKPPYQVIFSAYFESASALQNAQQNPRMREVLGDIQNFYSSTRS